MEIQKATGVVLSSRQSGEADYISTIYTKEFGKRNFVFKGLQRSKRRPQIVSEPGTSVNVIYYFHDNKTSFIVNEYQVTKHNIGIRSDLKKIYSLYFLLSLIEKTTGFDDKNKHIFDLVSAGVDNIPQSAFHEHFSVFFSLHLLKLHGILPDFTRCKICDRTDYSTFFIDGADFHPVCPKCKSHITGKSISFDKGSKEYIHQSLKKKFASIDHSIFPSKNMLDLLFHTTLFIESYYHVQIKPKDLLLSELAEQ